MSTPDPFQPKPLSLAKAVSYLLEECRIVLPGIQVLFGFQLIVVFSTRFATALTPHEQRLHLLATALVAVATALDHGAGRLPPAERAAADQPVASARVHPACCSRACRRWRSRISLDFYLVARVVMGDSRRRLDGAGCCWRCSSALWLVLPQVARWRADDDRTNRRLSGTGDSTATSSRCCCCCSRHICA